MIFNNYDLDFIVLEVGLGGRLDAINTIEPDVSLITSIGLDHTEWLGNTREEIALEKAGIMRPGKSVVCADKEVPFSIHSHASNIDAKLSVLGVDYSFELEDEFWDWSTKSRAFLALPYPAMFGKHQLRNISGVLKVLELLNIDERLLESSVRKVLPSLAILGRLQSIPNRLGMEIIVDVAHNEPAAEILSRRLQAMNRVKTTVGVLGILEAKDHLSFLKHFVPQLDYLYLVDLDHPRASQAQDVMKLAKSLDKKLETSCHSSCSQILGEIFKNNELIDRMVITGSFVTVGEAIKVIQGMHLDG
jgi:dihydrofolate synthase/folylpolyglutamate synthase